MEQQETLDKQQCQQCSLPLFIKQDFEKQKFQNEFNQFEQEIKKLDEKWQIQEDVNHKEIFENILQQNAICFEEDDLSGASASVKKALKIKDFSEQKNILLKHPVCNECFVEVLENLKQKVDAQEQEREIYKKELEQIEMELMEINSQSDEQLLKELEDLENEEKKLDNQIQKLQKDEQTQNDYIQKLEKEQNDIIEKEQKIWEEMNQYEINMYSSFQTNQQMKGQIDSMGQLYQRMRKTNFINEVFNISTLNEFGTISGFRLGRIESMSDVKWEEINTALGQTAYLMAIIAHRFGYKFERYYINLCGSMTTIQLQSESKTTYELYYEKAVVQEDKFNKALCCLLDCLQQLQDAVKIQVKENQNQKPIKLLFQIELQPNYLIGGKPIKYNSNDTQTWTSAMKFFLTNLQWLIYMTQLRDIQEQSKNLAQSNNFSTTS